MTARSSLEEALEFLLNEDEEKANLAFHNFIIKSAQSIHESFIAEDDLDNDIDESDDTADKDDEVNEADDSEEVDESKKDEEIDESKDKEEVDENFGGVQADEYFSRDELTTEDDMDMDDEGGEMGMDMEMGDDEAEADLGDEMGAEGEEVTLDASDVEELRATLDDLQSKFDALVGGGEGDEMGMDMDMDMEPEGGDMDDMEMEPDEGLGETGPNDPENINRKTGAIGRDGQYSSGRMQYESKEEDLDEDEDELDEAITHEAGVVAKKNAKTDPHGKHSQGTSNLHNSDARLPEAATFDYDLTEEDFLDLEEGLKTIDVKMGGEQGGGKFAGEETQTVSPVADKDSSKLLGTGSKDMISKRDDHSGYNRESEPTSGKLPHAEDNSKDKASPLTDVAKGGGLEKQKGYGEGEVGEGKFAGTETNVKSPIGSAGTRNES